MRLFVSLVLISMLSSAVLLPSRVLALPDPSTAFTGTMPAVVDTVDTLAVQLATITTDTGAFAPGHQDFSRYNTPGLCRAAAEVAYAGFYHSLEAQLVRDTGGVDIAGLGVTAGIARKCGARFTLVNTESRAFGDLFRLALYEQNDTLAQAVLVQLAEQAKSPEDSNSVWEFGMQSFLDFGRLAAAEVLMAKVDASSSTALPARLMMHGGLGFYFRRGSDRVRERQELETVRTLGLHDPDKGEGYPYVQMSWKWLVTLGILYQPDSVRVLAQKAQQDLQRYTLTDQQNKRGFVDWGHLPVDSVIAHLGEEAYRLYLLTLNKGLISVPRLQADYWLTAPGRSTSDTVVPVPGKVNLVCLGGAPTDSWQGVFNHQVLYSGFTQAFNLRRWLTEYGDQGLSVTIVREVKGWQYVAVGGLSAGTSRFLSPDVEAAHLWQWYDQTYHHLPVTVAVQINHTTEWLPEPDGRRLQMSGTQFPTYYQTLKKVEGAKGEYGIAPGSCSVFDREGKLIFSIEGGAGPGNGGWWIDIILEWLFKGAGATVVSPTHHPTPHAASATDASGASPTSRSAAVSSSLFPQSQ